MNIEPSGKIIEYGHGQDFLLEYVNDDKSMEVKIARIFEEPGVGESAIYSISGFYYAYHGTEVCITDKADLEYVNSHHNFGDKATAIFEDQRYDFKWIYKPSEDSFWEYELNVFKNSDNSLIEGPFLLTLVSGAIWP